MDDTQHANYACDTVPMNTPARQSLPDHLELRPIAGKGLGVVTRVSIPCNTNVGDYVGEVITCQVKDRRYLQTQQHLQQHDDLAWEEMRKHRGQTITGDYLYGVTIPGGADPIYIDAEDEYYSLWTRFLNHASPPGNNVNPKSIHQTYDGKPRVWFVANRDIDVGEELCFDYGDDYWLPGDESPTPQENKVTVPILPVEYRYSRATGPVLKLGSAKEALEGVDWKNVTTVCVGGFGLGGNPESLLKELCQNPHAKNLTVASLTGGIDGGGVGMLIEAGLVELTPQGTIAQRMRAAGSDIPAFFTPAGAGTVYAKGEIPIQLTKDGCMEVEMESEPRPTQTFDGKEYVMEYNESS